MSSHSLLYKNWSFPLYWNCQAFNEIDIERATDSFNASRIIGEGGFGPPSEKLGQMSGHMSGGACTLLRI